MESVIKQLHEALIEKYDLMQSGRCSKIAASFALEIYLQQELEDILLANEKRRA